MIVLDTSVLMAILQEEPEAAAFADIIGRNADVVIGAPTIFEFRLVTLRQKGAAYLPQADALTAELVTECVAWTENHATLATEALARFGGRPARLNFGDCMAYAVAKSLGAPLLFKGEDFRHTDIRAAL